MGLGLRLSSVFDGAEEAEVAAKLRAFREECDKLSSERWSGAILRSFMEWSSGLKLNDRRFTRWKKVAGIKAQNRLYGHGSFVLATAISQLKKEGQRVVTSKDVLERVTTIDKSLGLRIWAVEITSGKVGSEEKTIEGRNLPRLVEELVGVKRGEDFYLRNLKGYYSRTAFYTEAEVMAIALKIQAFVSPSNNKGKSNASRKR